MEQQYKSRVANQWYARELSVSLPHLTAITKLVSGKTLNALLLHRRLLEAKRLLTYSSWSVADIAYDLGFEDSSYFARFFKRETALSPAGFRQAAAKQGGR